MEHDHMASQNASSFSKSQRRSFYILLGIVAAYYLWGWHKEHVLQYWPFAIFLLCPLMHLFHRHGGHGQRHQSRPDSSKDQEN